MHHITFIAEVDDISHTSSAVLPPHGTTTAPFLKVMEFTSLAGTLEQTLVVIILSSMVLS